MNKAQNIALWYISIGMVIVSFFGVMQPPITNALYVCLVSLAATRECLQWVGNKLPTRFFVFRFCISSPERRLDQVQTSGGVGRALMKQLAIRLG
jgi:hypothetical protein